MKNLSTEENKTMELLLERMEEILNSDELMRNVDIVGELTKIVEDMYDI